jgi:hypothetical protein
LSIGIVTLGLTFTVKILEAAEPANWSLPFESGVKSFVPTQSTNFIQNIQNYQTLLPASWRGYTPIEQAYWAGKLGRSRIRVHGSGEFPSFFANNSRFPQSAGWNPAIGCL